VMSSVLDRAAVRGETREQISPRVARLPLDLLRHELILTHQPPSQRALEEIVDEIFLPLVLRNPQDLSRPGQAVGPDSAARSPNAST
jgi:hypothetical protein